MASETGTKEIFKPVQDAVTAKEEFLKPITVSFETPSMALIEDFELARIEHNHEVTRSVHSDFPEEALRSSFAILTGEATKFLNDPEKVSAIGTEIAKEWAAGKTGIPSPSQKEKTRDIERYLSMTPDQAVRAAYGKFGLNPDASAGDLRAHLRENKFLIGLRIDCVFDRYLLMCVLRDIKLGCPSAIAAKPGVTG